MYIYSLSAPTIVLAVPKGDNPGTYSERNSHTTPHPSANVIYITVKGVASGLGLRCLHQAGGWHTGIIGAPNWLQGSYGTAIWTIIALTQLQQQVKTKGPYEAQSLCWRRASDV